MLLGNKYVIDIVFAIVAVILIIVLVGGFATYLGYDMYKKAINRNKERILKYINDTTKTINASIDVKKTKSTNVKAVMVSQKLFINVIKILQA